MAIPVAIAAVGVRCFSDLVVDPKTPRFEFTVLPTDSLPWVVAADTATPFRAELLVDGSRANVDLDLLADSNSSIVEVLPRGRLLGKARGVARLVGRPVSSGLQLEGLRDTVRIRVVAASAAVLPVGVTLRSLGETAQLAGRALNARRDTIDSNAGQFAWTSANPGIATVDAAGRLTAVANGSARIKARIDAESASVDVTVSQVVDSVAVDSARLTLTALGGTGALAAVARDARGNALATQPLISWRSTNTSVATVSPATGASTTITAVSNGADTLWAKTSSDSTRVPVTVSQLVDTVVVSPSSLALTALGANGTLAAAARDARGNALVTQPPISWRGSTGRTSVAPATGPTTTVTAVSNGADTVWAKTGSDSTRVPVTVSQQTAAVVVTPADTTVSALGATVRYRAQARDARGNPIGGKIAFSWVSTNTAATTLSPASADSLTTATAVANGSTTIRATIDGVTGSTGLTVSQQTAAVVVTPADTTVTALGATVRYRAQARDARNNPIGGKLASNWTSTNTAVTTLSPASADSLTTATAAANGSTTIRATIDGVTGSTGLTVSQQASQLVFTAQPSTTVAGVVITPAPQLTARDEFGNTATNFTGSVTVAIGTNPSGGTLSGTTTANAVAGIATFSGLSIDRPGVGHTLTATASGLATAISAPFNITAGPVISTGGSHTCAVTTSGAAYCWGDNLRGQLGTGDTTSSSTPVAVLGGLSFRSVTAGFSHTCGVATTGAAYCWGDNSYGQLGDGTTTSSAVPVPVSGGLSFQSVSAGSRHTCGLTTSGAAYCWGPNGNGQLGDGSTTNSAVPVPVSGGLTFQTVSSGGIHACGVTVAGAAYCWGYGVDGRLGSGLYSNSSTPMAVYGGLSFGSVSAGSLHTCAVTTSGAAYCWGDNYWGALGDGTTTSDGWPTRVSGGLAFKSVSAGDGGGHTCGVTTSSAAYCWGYGANGRLGSSPPFGFATVPVAVSGGLSFESASAGPGAHSCGVTPAGAPYCWGGNSSGQLGDGTLTDSSTPLAVSGGLVLGAPVASVASVRR